MAKFDLSALLKDVPELGTERESITYLKLTDIDEDPRNFYLISGLEDLVANIELCGLQQPIRVRPNGERYTIISGHRRTAACRELGWEEIQAIIDRSEASEALQELRLIYANKSTRSMTSAEMSKQAERVTELLYRLKEEGMEFPGRMRDHVAEAVGVSKTKLSRLHAIREHLSEEWMPKYEDSTLAEDSAYKLSQLSSEDQHTLFLAISGNRYIYAVTIQHAVEEMRDAEASTPERCPDTHGECTHTEVRRIAAAKLNTWESLNCEPGRCCLRCDNLADCTHSCQKADAERKKLRAEIKAEQAAASEAKKEAERKANQPKLELLRESYARIHNLRELKGISKEEYLRVSDGGVYYNGTDRLTKAENGEVDLNHKLPGNIWAHEVQRLIATAELLGCTVDYLLGRDEPKQAPTAAAWNTGDPKKPGWYICRVMVDDVALPLYERKWWGGQKWAKTMDIEHITHWMPEVDE